MSELSFSLPMPQRAASMRRPRSNWKGVVAMETTREPCLRASRATTGASLYAFAAVWGLGYGMWAPQLVTVVGETFGLRNVASIMGLVGMSFGVGGTIGPALAGKIFSTSGSYSLAFYLGAGAMLLAAAIMVLLVKPARAPEPTAGTTATATALPERA